MAKVPAVSRFWVASTAAVFSCCLASPQAQVQFVASRAALGANDLVDWRQLGAPFTTVAGPVSFQSLGGLAISINQPLAGFEVYLQNPPEPHSIDENTGWAGSFAPGDGVLYTAAPGEGPVTIQFASPVQGGGAQVESGQYGAYTGRIEAFDPSGVTLGAFSVTGYSDNLADNSAVFLGLLSSTANIGRLEFSVITDRTADLAWNQLSLLTDPAVLIVPEPTVWSLLLTTGLLAMFRRGCGARLGDRAIRWPVRQRHYQGLAFTPGCSPDRRTFLLRQRP